MKEEYNAWIEAIARSICLETCAFKGEPPCWDNAFADEPFPPPTCDEPGCVALARAAYTAMALSPTPFPTPIKKDAETL